MEFSDNIGFGYGYVVIDESLPKKDDGRAQDQSPFPINVIRYF